MKHEIKQYIIRLSKALIGRNHIPIEAYWDFGEHIREEMKVVLPSYLLKHSHPFGYGSREAYNKDLQELLDLCYAVDDICYPKTLKQHLKEQRRYRILFAKLIPFLWD